MLARAVVVLLLVALVLPIAICVCAGVAALLGAVGDVAGGAVMGRIALGAGVLWTIDLIALVLVQAVAWLIERERQE